MELEMRGNKELVSVPDDMYVATVSNIKSAEYEFGPVLIISFRIENGPYSGKEVNGLAKAVLNQRSKFFEWVTALGLKPVEGEKVNTDFLVGKKCRVLTKTRTLTKPAGETPEKVSNVDKVYPV